MKISLPLGIALVMMGTHGYGLFLFGAILPTLQARHGFDYTFAGMASATLNTAMTGALLLGAFGRRLPAKRWFVLSVSCCALLLALLPLAPGPYAMLAAFIPLGMASAVSWSSAVGFVNGLARIQRRALILTLGASGGSWGMLTIGLMTGYGTKLMPPDWFWSVGAAFTLVGLAVLLPLMKEEAASASARAAPATPRATLGRQAAARGQPGHRPVRPAGCHGRAVHHLPERLSHQ